MRDRWLPLLLFVLVSSVYFATITGVTSSNDGSHYALTRAIADGRGFEISPYLSFTEDQDYATFGEQLYTDRPPGTALLSAPLYVLGQFGPQPTPLPSKHDAGNPHLVYAVMAAPLLMAGAVTLFHIVMRRWFGVGRGAALFAALILAFGTLYWKYGSVLYSHAAAAFVIWLGVLLIFGFADSPTPSLGFALGFVLGVAPLTEYTSALWSVIGGVAMLVIVFRQAPAAQRAELMGSFAVGATIPVIALLAYNTALFGGPLEFSRFHANIELWPENESLAATFSTPLPYGLRALLTFGDDGNQGLFLLMPVTLLSVIGLPAAFKRANWQMGLLLGTFITFLLVFAATTTFNPGTNDGRYLTPFLAMWLVPLAVWLDERQRAGGFHLWGAILLFAAVFLSVRNQMMHIALSWNYDFDRSALTSLAAAPRDIIYLLQTVFPNVRNLPLLWLFEGSGALVGAFIGRWRTWR